MKYLILTTIAAVLLVGCASDDGVITGDTIMEASSPLAEAARVRNTEGVIILLAEGHDIDERDIQYDATALQWAAEYGHEGIVEILISNGAELNALNNQGRTALHWAALNSKLETCKALIKKGAKLNIRDEKGETPIDFAMSNGSSNNDETIVFLRKHGAKTGKELKTIGK